MITITTNIQSVVAVQVKRLQSLADNDKMLRTCATTVLGLMKNRIHEDGKDANGNQIGTYSPAYMKIRTGNFANAARFVKGAKKGSLKNAGVFTKGAGKSAARPQYHRTNDTKVILSLTRQMENDMKVVAIENGAYGIGFSNPLNYNKAIWNQVRYKKPIYSLSEQERQAVLEIAQKFTHDALSQ